MEECLVGLRVVCRGCKRRLGVLGEDQLKRATIIVSSAIRLVVGGRAMLVKLASNHHTDINGRRGWRPRVRIRMRLCVRS